MSDTDFEVDEHGNIIPPPPPKLTWLNAGTEIPNRLGDAMAPKVTPEQQAQNELATMVAKNKAAMFAQRALQAARRVLPSIYQSQPMKAAERSLSDLDQAHRDPPLRDIGGIQREFSSEQEKQAYLDRIRQAQAAVKK
jgi:hypothetical protein